ncbi:response regulator [Clostridium sp. MD294]|uniref:response regulator n=1 Tax=Clostridium sp. MD294 TaxID=97138 RepID=UPI0002CAF166|nr:response regulator [Clostridium sp. MD294]NDO45375.1 response regulator [Clostridium sp. MD294]USF30984.1 Sensor histidine kinase RcsC [Clostridium sp. MD294]
MKKCRILAWFTFLLLFVSMVISVKQFQKEEINPFINSIQYSFNEDWHMVSLDNTGVWFQTYDDMQEIVRDAFATGNYQKVNLPYKGKSKPNDIIVFQTIILEEDTDLLRFTSIDTAVCVFLDGKLLYKYGFEPDGTPKEITGESEHIVNIPNQFENGELWIVQTSLYPNAASILDYVNLNTQDTVTINVFGNKITDVGCCLLIILSAFLMLLLELIRRYTHQLTKGELYIALVCIAAGISCFIATDTLSIFYNIHEAYTLQEYFPLMISLFLAMYFECVLSTIYPHRYTILLLFVVFSVLLQLLFNVLGVQTIEDMVLFPVFTIVIVCTVSIVGLLQFYYKHRYFQTLLVIGAIFIMFFGSIINIIFPNVNGNIIYHIYQYSMTAFSIIMAAAHILQLSQEYQKNVEKNARLLEEEIKVIEQQNIQLTLAKQDADTARREALAANEAKGKFLAHMSHEIRTPINAVLGMDEMILREAKQATIKEYAMDIYTAGQTLLSLINDILDFSKIESGKMEIVPVTYDISSMIHDLVNMTTQRAKNKNIKFEVNIAPEIPCQLYGDDVRIRQVLTNILTNAVKYTHEGTVWLRVKCSQINDVAILTFEVEDTGIGIKEEDLPKLSAEFERIEEDKNRNIEGTGLGMSITIQLLALLGSKLHIESIYGKGSKFFFELKQNIVDNTPIGNFEFRVQQMTQDYHYKTKLYAPDAKILVVDDNAVNRRVLRNLLKETGIQITDAESGTQCLELVQKNYYDLIFIDHMMPDMDGIETLHRIKTFEDFPCQNTPIVVLTANAITGAREQYLSEGFDDFLSKPIVPEKLENLIKNILPEQLLAEAISQQEYNYSPSEFLEELPPVDGLDWQYTWIHLPDKKLLEYTINEFYAQIDFAADRLEQLYEQITEVEQMEQYRIQVHAMKSLAATVGILTLAGVAKLLEDASRECNIETIASITPIFLSEWRSYRQKLQGVFDIGKTVRLQVNDISIILALLEMVRLSMQELDIDKADQLMEQLQNYAYSDDVEQNIKKLSEAVTNLDATKVNTYVELLMKQLKQ